MQQDILEVDVVVVGGGPAGLSAALVLGRCKRAVLLFDHGRYRNAASRAVHGFLTRDGTPPAELRRLAMEELARYPSVRTCPDEVMSAQRVPGGFELVSRAGQTVRCRKLVLATGVVDNIPPVHGLHELVGLCAFHCPYCDGWELRGQALLAYGHGDPGARFALELTVWSRDVVLCTDGQQLPSPELRERLALRGVPLREDALEKVEGDASHVRALFRDGASLQARAIFYSAGCSPGSNLAEQLGARIGPRGVDVGRLEDTDVPGLYVAGDASRDALQAIVAAGEGSKAAVAINQSFIREDLWSD